MSKTARLVSVALLLFLLLVRLADDYLPLWLFGPSVPAWFSWWYASILYACMALLVWLNRRMLQNLNVDRSFVVLVVVAGIWLFFSYDPAAGALLAGVLIGAVALFIAWALLSNRLEFGPSSAHQARAGILVGTCVAPALLVLSRGVIANSLVAPVDIRAAGVAIVNANLFGIVFEELLFRGALWGVLRDLGLGDGVIIIVQGVMFWIAHHRYFALQDWTIAWVLIPFLGIMLGVLAWRSKSIAWTTACHFLFNFAVGLSGGGP